MKPTELKQSLIPALDKLTLDDFYADPNLNVIHELFAKKTGLKVAEDVEKFLSELLPHVSVEAQRFELRKQLAEVETRLAESMAEKNVLQATAEEIEKTRLLLRNKLESIPQQRAKLNEEIQGIDKEIETIQPLADRKEYASKITQLQKRKQVLLTKIENLEEQKLSLQVELDSLNLRFDKALVTNDEHDTKIEQIKVEVDLLGKELHDLEVKESTSVKDEVEALELLFATLVKKKFQLVSVKKDVPTGRKITDRYWNEIDEMERVETGEVKLTTHTLSEKDYTNIILGSINTENCVPKNWRKLLLSYLNHDLPELSGTFELSEYSSEKYFRKETEDFSEFELSFLLALKQGLRMSCSVRNSKRQITLGLTGGVAAHIQFRAKGEVVADVSTEPLSIFRITYRNEAVSSNTLYTQSGYADSKVSMNIPHGYYFLGEQYVIQIVFTAAPVLFGNSQLAIVAPNISAKAKQEDDLEEERRRDEEYWDDYYDDDY